MLLPALIGYGLGSVPSAWMLVRRWSGVDLRDAGSGNVGATNALRSVGWRAGLTVALLDVTKGSAAVWLAALAGGGWTAGAVGAIGAVVGHVFPVWLRFRGGKGVATACGAFAVLAPLPTLLAVAGFLVLAGYTRLVSLASLGATLLLVAATWLSDVPPDARRAALAVAVLIAIRHRGNIARLAAGTERRLARGAGEPHASSRGAARAEPRGASR